MLKKTYHYQYFLQNGPSLITINIYLPMLTECLPHSKFKKTGWSANTHISIYEIGGKYYNVVVEVSFISNRIQQWNNTRKKHFVDIRKHIETLLHLSVVTREATGLIKLATKCIRSSFISPESVVEYAPPQMICSHDNYTTSSEEKIFKQLIHILCCSIWNLAHLCIPVSLPLRLWNSLYCICAHT